MYTPLSLPNAPYNTPSLLLSLHLRILFAHPHASSSRAAALLGVTGAAAAGSS